MLLKNNLKSSGSGQRLQLAGQSLREKSERLFDDRFFPYLLLITFAFWIVCLVEWTQKIAGAHPDPRFWMLMSILLTIYGGSRVYRLYPKLGRLHFGGRRQQNIAEILDRIRAKGFVALHAVSHNGFNVDHIVVGPSGLYAIETKTRTGSGTIEYRGDQELLLNGRINDSPAVRQARTSAQAAHLHLKERLHECYWVNPLLVFTGEWRVQQSSRDFAIDVIMEDQLEDYFDRQQSELTSAEIAHICSQLERSAAPS